MRLAQRIAGVLIAALLLAACDTKESHYVPKSTEPYQRWEAPGVWGASTGARNIYWIDNERVLYVGREDGESHERSTLRIWTPATGKVEVVGPAQGEVCYFRGYVTYAERSSELPFAKREGELGGPLDSVSDYLARHKALSENGFQLHPVNCRYYSSKDLAPGEHCKVPLLPGDGFLETQGNICDEDVQARIRTLRKAGPGNAEARAELARIEEERARRPVRYHPEKGPPIELPIEANEIGRFGYGIEYVDWRGQYLLKQFNAKGNPIHQSGTWPKGEDHYAYLLSPSGVLESIAIPITRYYLMAPAQIAVTKPGVVARLPGMTVDRSATHYGLVLYKDGRPAILDDGWTQEMALSPDGCRVAYSRQTGEATKASPVVKRVRAIDLCNRNN